MMGKVGSKSVVYFGMTEALSSDEDEIDDAQQDYLEALDRKIKSKASPFEIKSEVVDVSGKLFSCY